MDRKNVVSETKMLYLVSLLSKYDLFHVSVSSGKEFNCTNILNRKNGYLEFQRMFSTSIFSDCPITKIDVFEGCFLCNTDKFTYKIIPLDIKPEQMIIRTKRNWTDIADFMNLDYLSERFTTYFEQLDILVLVVDPRLLGELSIKEQRQIRRLINIYLEGSSISMQMSRTICFQVRLNDPRNRIYAGIYDLERRQSISSVPVYDEYDKEVVSDDLFEKAKALTRYAKSLKLIT